jgi:hypothetical protein
MEKEKKRTEDSYLHVIDDGVFIGLLIGWCSESAVDGLIAAAAWLAVGLVCLKALSCWRSLRPVQNEDV